MDPLPVIPYLDVSRHEEAVNATVHFGVGHHGHLGRFEGGLARAVGPVPVRPWADARFVR